MADTKTTTRTPCVAIRREDRNRWERRAPLAPKHVAELVKKGIKVLVQPSTVRTYADKKYEEAGAIIREDLSEADLIVAVKQVPSDLLLPDKTYMFFSHVIKAQPENMKMLDAILQKSIRLIDYEKITDNEGKRLVRFGKFAGYAGMLDTLHALGDRLLALGFSTPFLHLGYSYCYSSLDTAKQAVEHIGEELENVGLPADLVPMTFVFTSNGAVSQGAQEIFNLLPHKYVTPDEMVELHKDKSKANPNIVYGTIIESEHYVVPKDPAAKFDKNDYYAHPEKYTSNFHEKYLPSTSVIMNCMYWDLKYPRLVTFDQMKKLVEEKRSRLLAVGDISCDQGGSIEFLVRTTSIDSPLFVYDPKTFEVYSPQDDKNYMYKDGIVFLAVDNLPTEFPREATTWFGDCLLPFMEPIARSTMNQAYDGMMKELPSEVQKAVITYKHELTPSFKYIAEWRKRREADNKKILVLGAGFVAKPCVKYLRRVPTHLITVADVSVERAQKVAGKKSNTQGIAFDVNRQDLLEELIKDHDIVICLLPGQFNIGVAKVCMKYQRHLITANYISPEMRALDAEAKERGVLLLNETGLDPGIDHMTAMEHIDEVKENGGEITSFVSWCGGLPAPECSGNPLGYKFSWSPKGVLIASTRDALYRVLGQEVNVSGMELFKKSQKLNIFPAFALEGVPNRNSLAYADEYNIQSAETVFRGTLRYNGFSEVMEALVDLGLLSEKKLDYLAPEANKLTWSAFLKLFLNEGKTRPENISTRQTIIRKLISPPAFPSKGYDQDKVRRVLEAFEWLGLISDSEEIALLGTPMDALCAQLLKKLTFEPNDRDIVILHHIFGIKWSDGRRETRTSTLVVYGEPGGETAMSKTVGLPVAIAADLILKGEIKGSGVVGPIRKDIYKPMLEGLKNEGIEPVTKSSVFNVNI